jgi:hypothetical protein
LLVVRQEGLDAMTRRRKVLGTVIVFLLLFLAFESLILIANYHARRRAENLLKDVRTLRVLKSSLSDVRQLSDRHHGRETADDASACSEATVAYAVSVTNEPIYRAFTAFRLLQYYGFGKPLRWVHWLGLTPWEARAVFLVAGNRLCWLSYSIYIQKSDRGMQISGREELPFEIQTRGRLVADLPPESIRKSVREHPYNYVHGEVSPKFTTYRLESLVMREATGEEYRNTFDFHLSCLSDLGGCRNRCELMPSVWIDWILRLRMDDLDVEKFLQDEKLNDPRCPEVPEER